MKNTSDIDQASRINPFTRRRLLMGSSFLLGLAATSTTGSMIQAAQPISQKHKGKELLDKDSTCKRRIQGPGFYHVGLFTTDMDTTIRFYTEGFGFTKRYRWNLTRATEPLPTGEFVELKFNIEFLDLGDGNYLEVIGAGKPANELVGDYDLPLQHLALRVVDPDAAYARAVAAGAKPHYFYLDNNVVWDGKPLNFVIKSIDGDPPVNLRIGWVEGPNREVIELVRNDVL